jgi:hypothetical protein
MRKIWTKIQDWFADEINECYAIYLMTKSEDWHRKRHEKLKKKNGA